jgi:hypothetical protein
MLSRATAVASFKAASASIFGDFGVGVEGVLLRLFLLFLLAMCGVGSEEGEEDFASLVDVLGCVVGFVQGGGGASVAALLVSNRCDRIEPREEGGVGGPRRPEGVPLREVGIAEGGGDVGSQGAVLAPTRCLAGALTADPFGHGGFASHGVSDLVHEVDPPLSGERIERAVNTPSVGAA